MEGTSKKIVKPATRYARNAATTSTGSVTPIAPNVVFLRTEHAADQTRASSASPTHHANPSGPVRSSATIKPPSTNAEQPTSDAPDSIFACHIGERRAAC